MAIHETFSFTSRAQVDAVAAMLRREGLDPGPLGPMNQFEWCDMIMYQLADMRGCDRTRFRAAMVMVAGTALAFLETDAMVP